MSETIPLQLWGKTSKESDAYHPLLYHMMDVGNVALSLLLAPESAHLVERLARLLGCEASLAPNVVAFLIAAHDVGKASPSFAVKAPGQWQRVTEAGFTKPEQIIVSFDHALEANKTLVELLPSLGIFELAVDGRQARRIFEALSLGSGSHHGKLHNASYPASYPEIPTLEDGRGPWRAPWRQARVWLLQQLREVFLDGIDTIALEPTNLSALSVLLNGLTILSDWIASDETMFPADLRPLAEYRSESQLRARRALDARALLDFVSVPDEEPAFQDLFPSFVPRPLQTAVEPEHLPDLPDRALILVEAGMGEGKTEMALLLASRLTASGRSRGMYFALPTVATSNQMYERVHGHLSRWAGDRDKVSLLLINGRAELSEQFSAGLKAMAESGTYVQDGAIEIDSWLLPRKKSLLSPYGVGTVDQAMLGALNVRHVALRLLGLAGKVLIIDEVHAYDLYMSTILDRLLSWLHALGSSVILLSATLPATRRWQLVEAYSGQPRPELPPGEDQAYPLVTIVDGGQAAALPRLLPVSGSAVTKEVKLERRADGDEERAGTVAWLLEQVREGGNVAWLCNTVNEAQRCYRELKAAAETLPAEQRPQLVLFHARFTQERRAEIEDFVLKRFGPGVTRPDRAILVATQVVEQSLDLDFDLMLTQLAPVDLLLQRIGRLHRHATTERKPHLRQPCLVLLQPGRIGSHKSAFGAYGYVYHPFVLIKTLAVLAGREGLRVPEDVRTLVDQVYDDQIPTEAEASEAGLARDLFVAAKRERDVEQAQMEQEAMIRLLGEPDVKGNFHQHQGTQQDDDFSEADGFIAAQTRLAEPSVRVILLEEGSSLLARVAELAGRSGEQPVEPELVRALVRQSVSITSRPLVNYLLANPVDTRVTSLERHRALRGIYVLELCASTFTWPVQQSTYRLQLSDELGVEIGKEVD